MHARYEILKHPEASERLSASLKDGWNGAVQALRARSGLAQAGVFLAGTASGYDACIAGAAFLRRRGIPAQAADARVVLSGEISMPERGTLVILAGCSDDTSDTQALAASVRGSSVLVTVADRASPLHGLGTVCCDICSAGETEIPCTSFSNACTALWIISELLCGASDQALDAIAAKVSAYGYIREGNAVSGVPLTLERKKAFVGVKRVFAVTEPELPGGEHLRRLLLKAPRTVIPEAATLPLDGLRHLGTGDLAVIPDLLPELRGEVDRADAAVRAAGARTLLITNRDLASLPDRTVARIGARTFESAVLCLSVPVEMLLASWLDPEEAFLTGRAPASSV